MPLNLAFRLSALDRLATLRGPSITLLYCTVYNKYIAIIEQMWRVHKHHECRLGPLTALLDEGLTTERIMIAAGYRTDSGNPVNMEVGSTVYVTT